MNKNNRLAFAVSSAMLTLACIGCAGCAVGPDFKRPETPAVDGYTRSSPGPTEATAVPGGAAQHFEVGAAVPREWWLAFGSSKLNALVLQAFQHSPNIESAQAALRSAHELSAAQRGMYFPTVQASYSPSRQQNATGTISPTLTSGEALYTLHTAQLNIAYVPDVFGLNRRTVESLTAQEEAQKFALDATYLTLASNVATTAIQEAMLRSQIKATEDIIEALTRSVQLLHRQAELGFASGLDVAAQESALAQAQQGLPQLAKQLEQARDALAVLAGQFPAQGATAIFDLDELNLPQSLPVSLPSTLVEQRPDVRAAEAQVHAASAQVGIALANRLPQFSISALYGGTATQFNRMFSDDNQFWGITGNVAQTIFDAGTLHHRQNAAEAALDQASAQYRSTVLVAFQNVADTLYALDADAKTLAASSAAEIAAKRSMDLTRNQLELGYVNGLALLTAEQAYQQARITRIQAQAARYTDTVALFQALAGGWLVPQS